LLSTVTRTLAPTLGLDAAPAMLGDTKAATAAAPQINANLARIPTSSRPPRSAAGIK
jgi:hypothetical protein